MQKEVRRFLKPEFANLPANAVATNYSIIGKRKSTDALNYLISILAVGIQFLI